MFSKCAYQWNAVDVMGNDGLVHRGLVVNRSKSGLSIDFGIPNRESALISYEMLFRDPEQEQHTQQRQGDVELLYQLSPNQPWKWFPAQLLTSGESFALVDLQTDCAHVRTVFPPDRVRLPSVSRENVRINDFVKEIVPVPAGFLATRDFCRRWNEHFPRTHPVGVVEDRFFYIQRRSEKEIPLKLSISLVNMTEIEPDTLTRGMKRPLEDLSDETTENASPIMELPLEILVEVFNHVEILEQTNLRRVCARFNAVISSPFCNVAIVYAAVSERVLDDFIVASSLFTMLSRRVKYVIFAKHHDYLTGDIVMLRRMVNALGVKVPCLILADVAIHATRLVNFADFALSPTFRSICARLVLRNVTVAEALGKDGPYGRRYIHYEKILIDCCTLNTNDAGDLRHVFEENCDDPGSKVLRRLGQWMEALNTGRRQSVEDMVIRVLKRWQYDDIRFGSSCTWKDVELANLGKNMASLRKATIWALLIRKYRYKEDSSSDSSTDESEDGNSVSDELSMADSVEL